MRLVTHKKPEPTASKTTKTTSANSGKAPTKGKAAVKQEQKPGKPKKDESHKYEQYFDYSVSVRSVRPHQVGVLSNFHCKAMT